VLIDFFYFLKRAAVRANYPMYQYMEKLSGIIAELELRNAFIFRSIYKLENS
jgi:hypothetical protein